MGETFELICHHTYAAFDGLPVDHSTYDSHGEGIATQYVKAGLTPGSGALRFPGPQSRVRIPVSPAWQPLGGLKVEVIARRHPATGGQTLIAGHESFSFKIIGQFLFAFFRGKSTNTSWGNSDGLDSFTDAVDFQPHPVPIGKWVALGFLHDGFDGMQMFIDGQLVAQRTGLLAAVPPVGPLGVSIGSEPDLSSSSFTGEIDEVKVWRLNPYRIDTEFFSRPLSNEAGDCWEQFLRRLAAVFDRNPDCATFIRREVEAQVDRLVRSVIAKGPETRERFRKTTVEYRRLWSTGQLDSPAMARLLADWCAWLRLVGISIGGDESYQAFVQSECVREIVPQLGSLDCDPQFAALLQLVLQSCPPPSPRTAL